jgi:hypothetical protein
MELDDLRRQWQQPEPAESPAHLTTTELTRLVAQQSGSIVTKLRRNARWELAFNYAILPILLIAVVWTSLLWLRLFCGLMTLVAGVCIYYFHRKLGLLRDMDDLAGNLRGHLVRITQGMRTLIRFYYRLTLAMIPVAMLTNSLIALHELPKLNTPLKAGLMLGAMQVLGIFLYIPTKQLTIRYLQKLYGQHLDRLESQLRELDEPIRPITA